MKKYTLALISFLLVLVCVFFAVPRKAEADIVKKDLATVDEYYDTLNVLFTFDKEIVPITFISPSGRLYEQNGKNVDYSVSAKPKEVRYQITDPEHGLWTISYDPKRNGFVNYKVYRYYTYDKDKLPKISQKTGILRKNNTIAVKMKPHFACDYKILLIDKDLEREVAVIASGSARRGTMIKASADLTGFAAGRYYIKTIANPKESPFTITKSSKVYDFDREQAMPVTVKSVKVKKSGEKVNVTFQPESLYGSGEYVYACLHVADTDGHIVTVKSYKNNRMVPSDPVAIKKVKTGKKASVTADISTLDLAQGAYTIRVEIFRYPAFGYEADEYNQAKNQQIADPVLSKEFKITGK